MATHGRSQNRRRDRAPSRYVSPGSINPDAWVLKLPFKLVRLRYVRPLLNVLLPKTRQDARSLSRWRWRDGMAFVPFPEWMGASGRLDLTFRRPPRRPAKGTCAVGMANGSRSQAPKAQSPTPERGGLPGVVRSASAQSTTDSHAPSHLLALPADGFRNCVCMAGERYLASWPPGPSSQEGASPSAFGRGACRSTCDDVCLPSSKLLPQLRFAFPPSGASKIGSSYIW